MRNFLLLPALAVALSAVGLGATVYGEPADLSGSRTENGGFVTGGDWGSDSLTQSLSWEITQLGGSWLYTYTFANFASPGISHFILDLTDDCVPNNPGCVTDADGVLQFKEFGVEKGNPGFPVGSSIVGVKFDFASDSYTFESNRAPVWGDFYLKGGASFAYNTGLTTSPLSESTLDFIARPNGTTPTDVVPEPGTYALIGAGLGALALVRRRKAA
jgi:hypothetical protein